LDSPASPAASLFPVRALEPHDVRAVLAIQQSSPESAQWNAADYAHIDQSTARAWVAESAGSQTEVSGFLIVRQAADEMEILNLAVGQDYRRRGVASALLKAMLVHARECAAKKIFLEVRESNAAAISFYKRFGFNAAGYRANYYKNPDESALILALTV
jgi:ribosomal-protein-alanine acetyltransferase